MKPLESQAICASECFAFRSTVLVQFKTLQALNSLRGLRGLREAEHGKGASRVIGRQHKWLAMAAIIKPRANLVSAASASVFIMFLLEFRIKLTFYSL